MDYGVAVVSYRRAKTLREKTLSFLAKAHIPPRAITVFVADSVEAELYRATLDPTTYGSIVVGERGMGAIRRFVQKYYPEGTRIIHCDDDIDELIQRQDEKKATTFLEVEALAWEGWALCEKMRAHLWGIYAVANPYFMKHSVSTDLKYINGTFWGSINSHEDFLSVSLDDKEDFERSLKCYVADGTLVRFNHIAPKTRFYAEPGGMQEDRTEERITFSAHELVRRYPELCSLNLTKKSGHAEVRLRDCRKRLVPA